MKTTLALVAALTLPWLAACSSQKVTPPPATEVAVEGPAIASTEAVTSTAPTRIARQAPPPTATVDPEREPLAPVPVDGVPGIVAPAGAELVEQHEATDDNDASADFVISGFDSDELSAWFEERWPVAGWVYRDERDGALFFEHGKDLSARFASEGLKRTASVYFDTVEDLEDGQTGFSIVVEAPLPRSGGR